MLDPLFPERAREQVSAGRNCAFHSQMLLLTIGAVLSVAGLDMRASRRRRAETARAVPVDRAA
jgi:hypothetical protein